MKIAYAIHRGIQRVYVQTGKRPCEIILHTSNYRTLLEEMKCYATEYAQAECPLPRFQGIPIIVDSMCDKDLVYLPITPIFTCK